MPAGFSSFQVGDAAPPASRARPTCEPCRQRKVRCNRKLPCGHCSRLRLQCVYAKRSRRAPLGAHSGVSESPNSVSSPPASGDDSFGGRTGEPSNKEVLERLTNVERLLSDLVSSLSSGRLHQSVAEAGRAAQETAVAPKEPNRPCGKQLLIGGGERGNYIDESLFAEVLLGVSMTSLLGTQIEVDRSRIPKMNTHNLCRHDVSQITRLNHLALSLPMSSGTR